jgi:hypothetical protein
MGVLRLFRIKVAVNLCWEAGPSYLFIYLFIPFPLFLIARKCYSCIYRVVVLLVTKLGSNGCFEIIRLAGTLSLLVCFVCAFKS